MRFMSLKPNRIASGTGFFSWQVLAPVELGVLAALWAAALGLLLADRRSGVPFVLNGVLGNLVIVAVFLLAGRAAGRLMAGQEPFARVSLSAGAWVMILGAYVLVLSSVQRTGRRGVQALLAAAGFGAALALVASGYLEELSILKEYAVRRDRFAAELRRHMALSLTAVSLAVLIGVPLGILAYRKRPAEKPVFFTVNTVQTIPSLALFGLMIAPLALLSQRFPALRQVGIRGIGSTPAVIALTLYALLPITRNTYTSLKVLDPSVVESARGVGMSRLQVLFMVELPLALPIIMSGIRISLVQAVGNTTVAALIGAGGFGVFVFQGLGQAAPDLILLGAVPVILIAVAVDKGMQLAVEAATPRGVREEG
jgi:osmoprotectant transport system permease protein